MRIELAPGFLVRWRVSGLLHQLVQLTELVSIPVLRVMERCWRKTAVLMLEENISIVYVHTCRNALIGNSGYVVI